MAITKEKKVDILKKLKDKVLKAKTIVFVNFHKMPVALATDVRKNLNGQDVGYVVAKKTLIGLAFKDTAITGELPALDGEIAIAYGDDQIAPAKSIYEFQKKNAEMIKIVGGVFEGKFMDQASMMTIATIPPREILYGQFVNIINSPIQGFVMALDQIAKKREEVVA